MKYFFEIRGAEKIIKNGVTESGDDIVSERRRTKKAAFNAAEKILKRPDIFSVWIFHWQEDEDHWDNWVGLDDPLSQYSKYEDDLYWTDSNL